MCATFCGAPLKVVLPLHMQSRDSPPSHSKFGLVEPEVIGFTANLHEQIPAYMAMWQKEFYL